MAFGITTFLLVLTCSVLWEYTHFLGITQVDQREAECLFRSREMIAPSDVAELLFFENVNIPYDQEKNCLFITQSQERNWGGRITAKKGELFFLSDPFLFDKRNAIKQGHNFILIWMDDTDYTCFYCLFSGLPVLTLDTDTPVAEYTRDDVKGDLCLYAPSERKGKFEIVNSNCEFHRRGATNYSAPKENFKVSLKDESGEAQNKCSLLGMRTDDDWVLNPLWDDSFGIHNKLSYELWNTISQGNPEAKDGMIHLEYVELLVNGKYRGLYALTEYPDAKQFGLEEGDMLYRTNRHEEELDEDIESEMYLAQQENRALVDGLEVRFPKEDIGGTLSWQPLISWLDYVKGNSGTEAAQISVNEENCLDYFLFVEMAVAEDNVFKNCSVRAEYSEEGYEILKTPWDMNLTWGNCWSDDKNSEERNVVFLEEEAYETERYFCSDMKQILMKNPKETSEKIYRRWQNLRQGRCSDKAVIDMLESELAVLKNSGALKRDDALWHTCSYGPDEEQLKDFIVKRLHHLDSYYENLYYSNNK